MDDARLIKIETLLGHQDRQIQDLSDMIDIQRKEIDLLRRRLDKTQAKLVDLQAGGLDADETPLSPSEQAARDKPPHY